MSQKRNLKDIIHPHFGNLLIMPYGIIICLIGVLFAIYSVSHGLIRYFPILLLVITTLIVLVNNPSWGLISVIAMIPIVQILPPVEIVTSFLSLVGALTLVAYFLKNYKNNSISIGQNTKIYKLLIFIILLMLIGEFYSPLVANRSFFFTYLQLGILVWLSDKLLMSQEKIENLMFVYLITASTSAIIGIYPYLFQNIFWFALYRATGAVGNSNGLGINLSIAVVFAYHLLQVKRPIIFKSIIIAIIAINIYAIFLSGSRGAIMFLIPVLLYQIVVNRRRSNMINISMFFLIIVLIVGFIPQAYIDRVINIPTDLLEADNTVGLRLRLWESALDLWRTKPIFGIGPGMFYAMNQFNPLLAERALASHNVYITYLTENGIIGLAIFLLIVYFSLSYMFKAHQYSKNVSSGLLSLTVAWESTLFILLLNGTKANSGEHKMMWLCFGVSFILYSISMRKFDSIASKIDEKK